jgi:hypothetical protein
MKKLGISGWEISGIGAFRDRFGGDINVRLIRSLLKARVFWKGMEDGLSQEIKKKHFKKLFKSSIKKKRKLL